MILGVILRNYKCYRGLHYVPIFKDKPQSLNVIIGNNGVGKSTILEALDSLFNDAEWVINSDSSGKDAFVGISLLIEKELCESVLDDKERSILSVIGKAFWELDVKGNTVYEKNYLPFFEQRTQLVANRENAYLLIIGKQFASHELSLLSFDGSVGNYLEELSPKPNAQTISNILNKLLGIFSYLYIPVETTISDFLRLETSGMQLLADKNLKAAITTALNEKRVKRSNSKGKQTKSLSVIDLINEKLEEYISQIQNEIQKIDASYDFRPDYRQSTKLTPNHIANVIIDAFYSKRKLKKDKKPISTLSSGEKRTALIDIIYVFLSQNIIDRKLIIAIDEPESSLHISRCYNQFRKIQDIALKYDQQLFITTHWYGSLPILKSGNLLHIENSQKVSVFNLANYFEERGSHPDDINLKSFFDLASSIISAYRNSSCHWILVEGTEDKLYLEYYLKNKNIQIIPLCGCSNVKKIYEYLFTPISNSKQEVPNMVHPKILCIVDTDTLNTPLNVSSNTKNELLMIRRLYENPTSHKIELLTIENPNNSPTEIEEVLDSSLFYDTLTVAINNYGSDEEKEAFEAFEFDNAVLNSRIKGDYSIINHLGNGRNMRNDKEKIVRFIDSHKLEIAEIYINNPLGNIRPSWVDEIETLLSK